MSYCKANPCCADPFFCEIPLPQHRSGLYHLNDPKWKEKAKKEADEKYLSNRKGKLDNSRTKVVSRKANRSRQPKRDGSQD